MDGYFLENFEISDYLRDLKITHSRLFNLYLQYSFSRDLIIHAVVHIYSI